MDRIEIAKLRLKQGTTNPLSELTYTSDKYDLWLDDRDYFHITPKFRHVKTFIVHVGVVEFSIRCSARTWSDCDEPYPIPQLSDTAKPRRGRPPKSLIE